jgi:kinesin family member 5
MEEHDAGNIKVVCRVRPLNEKEFQRSEEMCLEISRQKKTVDCRSENGDLLSFTFDDVFSSSCTQEEVYRIAAKPIINAVFEGFNGTILAYGQTASGKTFTMTGDDTPASINAGIIPRIVNDLFLKIEATEKPLEFTLKISYCEIYLEKIKDLIEPTKNNLRIQEDKVRGVHIPELTEHYALDPFRIFELMKTGKENREFGQTLMNESSSRSHAIFIITIKQENTVDYSAKCSKLYLVDLAGSEKVGKTGAEGKRLEEAKNINKSLTTLGLVITALTDQKSTHIPYRDSKLTRVLQDSLGGNSQTTLVLTCSPSFWNAEETLSTLRFGMRAKAIKNKPKINKEYTVNELKLMIYAANEKIAARDKIIESLRGEASRYLEEDQSMSVPGFSGTEIAETIKEIEKIKETLEIQITKNLKLENEKNQIESLLDNEKKENQRLFNQLTIQTNNNIVFENEIKIKEDLIKIYLIDLQSLKSESEHLNKKIEQAEEFIKDLNTQNQIKSQEIVSLQCQLQNLRSIELQKLAGSLETEKNINKKIEEEKNLLREKLDAMLSKYIDPEQLKENIRESIEHKEKEKWMIEKKSMLEYFEEYVDKVACLNNEIEQMRNLIVFLQKNINDSQKYLKNTVNDLKENNEKLRLNYHKLSSKLITASDDKQNICEKTINLNILIELLEKKLTMYNHKIGSAENYLNFLNKAIVEKNSLNAQKFKSGSHIKKTIKGGKTSSNFTPSPIKDVSIAYSDTSITTQFLEINES